MKTAPEPEDDGTCKRCRCCSTVWARCTECGGEGYGGSACIDDMCHGQERCIHGDEEELPCHICEGAGGSSVCGGACCEHGWHKDEPICTERCKTWRAVEVEEF